MSPLFVEQWRFALQNYSLEEKYECCKIELNFQKIYSSKLEDRDK